MFCNPFDLSADSLENAFLGNVPCSCTIIRILPKAGQLAMLCRALKGGSEPSAAETPLEIESGQIYSPLSLDAIYVPSMSRWKVMKNKVLPKFQSFGPGSIQKKEGQFI